MGRAFIKNILSFLKLNPAVAKEANLSMKYIRRIELPKITGRKKKTLPETISEEEVHLIKRAMSGRRNKIMLLLTYYCGLRQNELLTLTYANIYMADWAQHPDQYGKIKVFGKGNKEGYCYVPPEIMRRFYKFFLKNTVYAEDIKKPIFHVHKSQWWNILNKASIAGIGRHINPHLLRHSFATNMYKKGLDIMTLKNVLRHSSLNSTQLYTHVNEKETIANLTKVNLQA